MKKMMIILALSTSIASAYGMTLQTCSFTGYNPDFGGSFYTGVYRAFSGQYYTRLFDSSIYSWCPHNL